MPFDLVISACSNMITRVYNKKREGECPTPYTAVQLNAMRIIKFEWFTQTNCETHRCSSWVVPWRTVLDQLLANTHLNYMVTGSILQFTRIYGFNYPQSRRLHSYMQSRILSLSLLLYTLDDNYYAYFSSYMSS